ncbi:Ig-like domain-containing protein [Schinkia sp. CFF1]
MRIALTNSHCYCSLKVVGKDHSSKGIVKLFCKIDAKNSYDDIENNIADRWKYETTHTYTITIDNGNSANVLINDVINLNCTVTDNGQNVENPAITYISSDPSIVSVDNSGKVMGINGGQATITARLTYNSTVVDTISITTVEEVVHNYSVTIEGDSTITVSSSKSFVARFYDNGTEVFDQSGTWSIRNQDGTTNTYATITALTGNSVTVKAERFSNKYIILSCTLVGDPNIKVEKTIQIKGIF